MPLTVKELSGDSATLPEDALEMLRMTIRGGVIAPDDPGYDGTRIVFNAMFDRKPGLIIRCSGTADVIDAVNFAREHELLTAVRAGGHSIAGHGVCDGGLMIDLSPMNGVLVDPTKKTVRVQGGATWGDVDREAQAFGLAVPGGIVSATGVAGLTLGGGLGWLHRKFGLSIDSLRSAEIVTADGTLVKASDKETPDLFWAIRGGGGNFGVVTALEFKAHPMGPIVYAAAPIYGVDRALELLTRWRDWADTAPNEVTSRAVMWSMPESEHLPPEVHNKDVVILGAVYAGPPDKGEKKLAPLRTFGTPLADLSAAMPFRFFQSAFDPFFPKGEISSYWKSVFLPELTDEPLQLIAKHGLNRRSPLTIIHVPLMGGAISKVGADDTAFGDRSGRYMLSVDGNVTDRSEAQNEVKWVRDVISDVEPYSTGIAYLNFTGHEDSTSQVVESAYGRNLKRLQNVKRRYDPYNLFRVNNNIPPA